MNTLTFPSNFFFGVADADLQVVGEDFARKAENSQQTMWYHYAKNSGKVYKNQTPGIGVNRYELWREDVEQMQKMGVTHYRTSISMARMLHQDGSVNSKALSWYEDYYRTLTKSGIAVYATLYHWELPYYLSTKGGWTNKATIDYFLKHVEAVVKNLGEYIEEYFILNEPRCSSLVAHYLGEHAPGEQNLAHALSAGHNLLLAQGLAARTIKEIDPNSNISAALNVGPRYSYSLKEADIEATNTVDSFKNTWFLDPIFLGQYPQNLVTMYGNAMPKISKGDMEIIKIGDMLHSLGLNFYRGDIVKHDKNHELGFKTVLKKEGMTTDLGWGIYIPPIYRDALYDILSQVYFAYRSFGLKQIYITENGLALESKWDSKQKVINDEKRIFYMKEHIRQVHNAIERGIPVKGYFAWTLMDNFEWAKGYAENSRFGLIYVDRDSLKRVWKKSAHWYKELISDNILRM